MNRQGCGQNSFTGNYKNGAHEIHQTAKKGGQHTQRNISQLHRLKKYPRSLEKELKDFRDAGIRLYLNDKPSTPRAIAHACHVAEQGGYMRDYSEGEKGRISRVNFRFIKQ